MGVRDDGYRDAGASPNHGGSRVNRMFRTMTAALALALPLAVMQPAGAATAPDLTCGNTTPGPCQQTAHFTDINDLNTPAPPGGGCPAYLATDFFTFVGTGHGVEHINVNKAQDAWFTSTFTGKVTITAYLNGTFDSDGNLTGVTDPDPNVLPYSGRITEWFGGSFNNKNSVSTQTINVSVTNANGDHLRVHVVSHQSWAPGSDPNGPPTKEFSKITCS
jgi:hypothetical protein